MKKIALSPVDQSTADTLIRQFLDNFYAPGKSPHTYGELTVRESEMREYVKAAYIQLSVTGPRQESINTFLQNRMILSYFFVPALNSLVVSELVPDPQCVFEQQVHCIHLGTGENDGVDLQGASVKGVRPGTAELLVRNEPTGEWSLFDISDGRMRPLGTRGFECFLSADGRLLFLSDRWSSVSLIDLDSGKELDEKNKRHFCRYATKVKIIEAIHFDPDKPCLFLLLMKQQELSLTSLRKEACIQLTIEEAE